MVPSRGGVQGLQRVRRPSGDVGKIARAMHDATDFKNVLMRNVEHDVIAEHAEAHAPAKLGTEPPRLGECDQFAAMLAQLLHKRDRAGGVVPRAVGRYFLKIDFGSSTKPKLPQRVEARPVIAP